MNPKLLSTVCLLCMAMGLSAQVPNGTGTYYCKANGKKGRELKTAFYQIINTPSVVDYDSLWVAYRTSDAIPTDTVPIIWDMYSCNSHYSVYTNLHRNGKAGTDPEGTKGFQREHSMPKSWFNPVAKSGSSYTYKDIWPMYSDLMHVIPAEGIVNNKRSNNPYGTNNGEWYTSEEGFSKMGANTYSSDYTGRCFEPNDEYKGDIARIYFYMVTAYEKKQSTWSGTTDGVGDHCGTWTGAMFNQEDDDPYQPFSPWAFQMLMEWSKNDPVSQKEIDRNEATWIIQGNRNPFVDYPGLEDYIWGDKQDEAFDYGGEPMEEESVSEDCEFVLNKDVLGVDWSDSNNMRDYWTRTPISFEKNGITFTFNYGICGKLLYADEDKIRLYNYNTLTLKAHHNDFMKVEFTIPGRNHEDKTLVASVGEMSDNVWTGKADEIVFTSDYVQSKYNPGTQTTTQYYLELSNIQVTMVNSTGIEELQRAVVTDGRIYNLMGVQVDEHRLTPGIYVKNGRKFVYR